MYYGYIIIIIIHNFHWYICTLLIENQLLQKSHDHRKEKRYYIEIVSHIMIKNVFAG